MAVGDECGKIYVLYNFMASSQAKLVVQSLPHWHASSVNCLSFTDSNSLVSAGKESVLVRWNLDTQDKTFISRLGQGEIMQLSLSESEFFSCVFGDNSFKVCRQDNNKVCISSSNLQLDDSSKISMIDNQTAIVTGSKIQLKSFDDNSPSVTVIETNQRNYTSTDHKGQ